MHKSTLYTLQGLVLLRSVKGARALALFLSIVSRGKSVLHCEITAAVFKEYCCLQQLMTSTLKDKVQPGKALPEPLLPSRQRPGYTFLLGYNLLIKRVQRANPVTPAAPLSKPSQTRHTFSQ